MATMPVTCYQAKCDYCGALYESADGEYQIFGDRRDAEEAAIGWKLDETAGGLRMLTCPACLRCEKCGASPAWVGGDQYEDHGLVLCEECEPGALTVADDPNDVVVTCPVSVIGRCDHLGGLMHDCAEGHAHDGAHECGCGHRWTDPDDG